MHGMVVDEEYPTGSVGGCDFFTRTARGEIIEDGPDGPLTRPEKVLITDRYVDMDDAIVGQICVSERTMRHFAHDFGMVDGWKVERLIDDNHSLRSELVDLSTTVAALRGQIAVMEQMAERETREVYVALDGTRHESMRGSRERSAEVAGLDSILVTRATPVMVPDRQGVQA